jgi:hypothetical protein
MAGSGTKRAIPAATVGAPARNFTTEAKNAISATELQGEPGIVVAEGAVGDPGGIPTTAAGEAVDDRPVLPDRGASDPDDPEADAGAAGDPDAGSVKDVAEPAAARDIEGPPILPAAPAGTRRPPGSSSGLDFLIATLPQVEALARDDGVSPEEARRSFRESFRAGPVEDAARCLPDVEEGAKDLRAPPEVES